VTDVEPYSEAFNRGLMRNDVITSADRKPVNSVDELKEIIRKHESGDVVLFRVKSPNGISRFIALNIP
jgi:S1-C subfamily serine protease